MVSSLLDPRFKFGPGFSPDDKNDIWNIIRQMMIDEVDNNDDDDYGDESVDAEQNNPAQQQMRRGPHRHAGYVDEMFVELDELAMAEQVEHQQNNLNPVNDDVMNRVDAELLLYKRERHLQLRKAGGTFNNPSAWWQLKQQQYPLLAGVALKVLAIPATSAPSERVFSVAGLTIAKERSRLDPANAGELIFLHDIRNTLRIYDGSVNDQMHLG